MFKEMKCRICSVKSMVILVGLMLVAVYIYAQTPVWEWATQAGGTYLDGGYGITLDNYGCIYITGRFYGTATFGYYSLTSTGWFDIFFARMSKTGNWICVNKAGGIEPDQGNSITMDASSDAYVTGCFQETASFGSYSLTSSGFHDIFVAKIDSSCNWLWATKAGGTDSDFGYGITNDAAGNSYVTGYFNGTATFGSYSLTSSGNYDMFVAKVDASGNWLWATKAGGTSIDIGNGITIDAAGNSYVTGYFVGTATFGPYSLTSIGDQEIFVAKMDASGNWLWATKAGGTGRDEGYGIKIDAAGNSYVTGYFVGTATFGSYSTTGSSSYDIFVAKMDGDGNWLWVTQAGGTNVSYGYGITTDAAGNSYVTGRFSGTPIFGSYSLTSSGLADIFVAKINTDGDWQWAAKAGGTGLERGIGITIDAAGNSYVTGRFDGTASFGPHSLTSTSVSCCDIFVAKLNSGVSIDQESNLVIGNITNNPNPFNQRTTVNYALKREAQICLEIYNIKGQLVETLFEGTQQLGDHTVEWNCQDMPSGVYFFKMQKSNESFIRKMILLR